MATQLPEQIHTFTSSYLRPARLGQVDGFCEGPPPTAMVFSPSESQRIFAGDVVVKGYAMTGIFNEIKRVELSLDNGKSWIQADLSLNPQPGEWRLWRKRLTLNPGFYELIVRATDNIPRKASFDAKLTWQQVSFEVIARKSA